MSGSIPRKHWTAVQSVQSWCSAKVYSNLNAERTRTALISVWSYQFAL